MKPLLIASLIASGILVSGCKLPGNDQDSAPAPAPLAPVAHPQATLAAPADNPLAPQTMAATPEPVPGVPTQPSASVLPVEQAAQPAPMHAPHTVAPVPLPSPVQVAPVRQFLTNGGHDQFELCEADSWQKAIQVCKEGQLVSIIPTKMSGGDQFQLATSAGICDFTQQIISRVGGVVCVFTRKRFDFVMAEQAKADEDRKINEAREKDEKAAKKAAQMAAEAVAAANVQVRQKSQPKVIDPITGEPVQPTPKARHRPVVADQPQPSPFGPRE